MVLMPQTQIGNPFAPADERLPGFTEWAITANEQAKYMAIFSSCSPADGVLGGEVAKVCQSGKIHYAIGQLFT